MRQRKVLNEDEWFNPDFENFINKEVAGLEEINKGAALVILSSFRMHH
jgi:hypothetical protein